MPARIDRRGKIVGEAVRAVQQSAPATGALVGAGGGSGGTNPGGQSIQDGEGRLRWMWGVSIWTDGGESDVFSDG